MNFCRTILTFCRRMPAVLAAAAAVSFASPALAAPKDTITIGMAVEPSGLDPSVAAPVAIGQVTWGNVFEGLTRIDRDGEVQPQLAESWEIAPDGLSWRFRLRQGVRFHNGEAFDSASAKFTLERAIADDSVNPQKRYLAAIAGIETPDAETLVLKLDRPAGSLAYWLAWPAFVMVEPKSAENNRVHPVGTGPFRFVEWVKGVRVELARNEDYRDAGQPVALAKAVFRFINDPQAQAAALRAGDVDAFPQFSAPELIASLKSDPRLAIVIGDTEMKVVAGMNNARKPFDDIRVRQALMKAVDRALVIEGAWSGFGTPIGSHYTPNDSGYVDLTALHGFDPQAARQLLAEAGYPNGFSFTLKAPQMAYAQRSAQILQALLAEIGVTMRIETVEFPAKWVADVFRGGDFDMTIVAHAEPMDIDIFARDPYYFNYRNPRFNAVLEAVEATGEAGERARLYGEAQTILAEDVPALFLFVMPKLGVWNRNITGLWENEPIPSNVLAEVRWLE